MLVVVLGKFKEETLIIISSLDSGVQRASSIIKEPQQNNEGGNAKNTTKLQRTSIPFTLLAVTVATK